jgi:hypothetical protein
MNESGTKFAIHPLGEELHLFDHHEDTILLSTEPSRSSNIPYARQIRNKVNNRPNGPLFTLYIQVGCTGVILDE